MLDPTVQGNQRDHIREEQWDELAQNSNLRLNAVQSAKERVLARLGGRYSPEKKVEREMRREERKGRGGVMDEVRKEMFGGDGEGWIGESNIVREGSVRGRDRESVPLMIFR